MTWEELAAHIQATQSVTEVGEGSLKLWWSGAGTREAGPQKLAVFSASVVDVKCVVILTLIGPDWEISPEEALAMSGTLVFGALMLKHGRNLLRVSALLDSLTITELETLLAYTAATGAALRRRSARPAVDASAFTWMQD